MSVRVLAAGAAGVRRLEPVAEPLVARIPAEVVAAREEAAALVARAEAEAEAVRARAHADGLAAARAEAAALLLSCRLDEARAEARLAGLVARAAGAVAERLLGDALAEDEAALEAWARRSLVAFGRARRVELRCHADTAARLQGALARLLPDPDAICVIVPDAAIAPHTLVVHADNGDAHVELTAQVEALIASLAPLLTAEVRGG